MQKITLIQYANNIKIKSEEKPTTATNKTYLESIIESIIKRRFFK